MSLEWIAFAVYALLGPGSWVLYAYGTFTWRSRLSLLRKTYPLPEPPPRVSIIIPAKNEGKGIAPCLESALAQDYPNFEVLAIDDRSTDETGQIMDALAAKNPLLRVIHNTEGPPPGWTGKCNALHRHIPSATGQWLLLVDSDVVLEPQVLRNTLSVAANRGYGLLSLLLKLETRSFWEGLLMPLCGGAIMGLHTVGLANQPSYPKVAFANGQYILIHQETYKAIGGHEAVKDKFSEDIAIAHLAKQKGLKPRVAWGMDQAAVRMYSGKEALLRGWARNFYGAGLGRPWRILAGMAFVIICGFSAYVMLGYGIWRAMNPAANFLDHLWLPTAIIHFVLMMFLLAAHYELSGNRWWNALLFPIGGSMLVRIFIKSLVLCATGKVQWRGDAYAAPGTPAP